jgi:purine-binding chemotaxis protein CheW
MVRHRHDPSKDLVGFAVGEVAYAVRIGAVREIVQPLPIVDLPRAPFSVRGVASYRGEVVPVVDLRERFGLPPLAASRRIKWIVINVRARVGKSAVLSHEAMPVDTHSRHAALVVDSVSDVFGIPGGELLPAPPLGEGADLRALEGVTKRGQGLVFVLDERALSAVTEDALGAWSREREG